MSGQGYLDLPGAIQPSLLDAPRHGLDSSACAGPEQGLSDGRPIGVAKNVLVKWALLTLSNENPSATTVSLFQRLGAANNVDVKWCLRDDVRVLGSASWWVRKLDPAVGCRLERSRVHFDTAVRFGWIPTQQWLLLRLVAGLRENDKLCQILVDIKDTNCAVGSTIEALYLCAMSRRLAAPCCPIM